MSIYDELFNERVRREEIEAHLAKVGLYVLREGEAVLGGRVYCVKACDHRNCRNDSHARLEVPS